jgi:arsenite-transporting ATPase
MPEVVLYGGKGGVGKTTCAAATGVAAASAGVETLVVSTDPAHSLGDIFGTELGGEPTSVREGLSAAETDPAGGTAQYEALFEALIEDLDSVGVDLEEAGLRDLFASGLLPGSDELAALSNIDRFAADDRWDQVVFDTAPTGHTLRLLDLPDAVGTGVRTAQSLHDQVSRKARAARTMLFGPYATAGEDGEDTSFSEVLAEMERVRSVLRDPDRTEFRVVCLPERLVVAETERLVERLRDAGVPVGQLLVNRVLTDIDGDCARCRAQRESQQAVLETIRETFPDLEIVELPDTTGKPADGTTLELLAEQVEPV